LKPENDNHTNKGHAMKTRALMMSFDWGGLVSIALLIALGVISAL
jgi:hypothetical protein